MKDLEFPPKPRFVIVNDFDRPSEEFIAELAPDGLYYYIHPELRSEWANQGLSAQLATPIEKFGIEWTEEAGHLVGTLAHFSSATYQNGSGRVWQGGTNFRFKYSGPPGTKIPMNLLDLLPNPKDVGADEYTAIYEVLDSTECATDLPFAIAVLEEFIDHAQSCITRIQTAMEGMPPDALESTRFSRN